MSTIQCCCESGVTLPGCACVDMPATLHATRTGFDPRFPAASWDFLYQARPSCLAAAIAVPSIYLSTTTFTDAGTGDTYWYTFTCYLAGQYVIRRAYCTSLIGGSPYWETPIYIWNIGATGNSCSPFVMSNGSIYAGGDAGCSITVTG